MSQIRVFHLFGEMAMFQLDDDEPTSLPIEQWVGNHPSTATLEFQEVATVFSGDYFINHFKDPY